MFFLIGSRLPAPGSSRQNAVPGIISISDEYPPPDPRHCDRARRRVRALAQQPPVTPAARAAADSGRPPYTAADVAFMTGMIGHHAQAVLIAGWAPSHGASASVLVLCERIVVAQNDEIATMEGWLKARKLPVPDPGAAQHMMMPGMEHAALMPGMLTRGADGAARQCARPRLRPALPHLHDPAPPGRAHHGGPALQVPRARCRMT